MKIPFNIPPVVGKEKEYVMQAIELRKLSGDGSFTKKCSEFMEDRFNAKKVLLTTSCTSALDMAAILLDFREGDEFIVSPYTFTSTVTSFCLRGAKPVFVDIREDTLNIDESKIEEKITNKTKAIVVTHYAGVGCAMDVINRIAKKHNLYVVEDAAQGVDAKYKGKYLGTIGDLGTYSFHETKNYVCGEGGALIINNDAFIERAEIIREKGTNRNKFLRGEVDKYTWVDIGSSYLPSELVAAYLYAQLENKDKILSKRKKIYDHYCMNLKSLEQKGFMKLPTIPEYCDSNYHMFYIILNSEDDRTGLINHLKKNDILAVSHYVPLHTSPMGVKFGCDKEVLPITDKAGNCLLRLPFYYDLELKDVDFIISKIKGYFNYTF